MLTVEDFAATFPSERVLQQALARLLAKIPGHTGVQILQGPDELGKDLIFYTPGPFGTKDLNACVVKNTKITGDAKTTVGARTVFNQAQQALDTPLLDENGREQRVRRVFIITPHQIPQATAASILGALRTQDDRVQFIRGATLLGLFKDHWPGYLAEEYKLIQTYADALAQSTTTTRELQGLSFQYQLGQVESDIKRVYVKPNFHRIVRSYSLHPLLDTIPSQVEYGTYSHEAVSQMIAGLKRADAFVTMLHKWGLCTPDLSARARQACEVLVNAIESDWSKTLAALAATGKSSAARQSFSAGFRNPRELNGLCQAAARALSEAYKQLQSEIAFAARHIETAAVLRGLELNVDEEQRYALLDDLARTVGSSCIREVDECSDTFDSGLIDVYRGPLFLVAPAGFGKTSFCRWHALNDLENLMQACATTLPVYVPLHQVGRLGNKDFKHAFLLHAGVSALLPPTTDIQYDRTRVYLDGLDEVADQVTQNRIARLARQASEADPTLQVIITARDYVFGPFMTWLPRIRLSGFSPDQERELVSNWLDQNVAMIERFFSQLQLASVLSDMMEIPLLATLIVLVFKQTGKLPENKTRLYEMFVDLHNGGWDLAKGIQRPSRFSAAEKMFILKRIAAKMHFASRREMIEDLCETVARDTFKKLDWSALKSELVRDGLLVQLGGAMGFSHQSFQEFLTAKQLLGDPNGTQLCRCCDEYLNGSDWWYEVLCFYMDLVGKPQELHQWLRERFQAASSPQRQERIELLHEHLKKTFPYAKL